MTIKFNAKWKRLQKKFGKKFVDNIKKVGLSQVAAMYEGKMVLNIRSGGALAGKPFKPLSPVTVARKGTDTPLIDKGDMWRSIKGSRFKKDVYFVGIKQGKKSKKGNEIVNYAAVHEYGAIINTESGGVRIIPKRPFIVPVYKKFKRTAIKLFKSITKKFKRGEMK